MSRKSFMDRYSKYLYQDKNSNNTNKVISVRDKKVERPEENKITKKGEKEMKKSNKTNKIERKENVKEMKETKQETKKITLTQRVSNLEQFAKKQMEFNNKIVNGLTEKFKVYDNKLDSLFKGKETIKTKETKKETSKKATKKVETKKKETKTKKAKQNANSEKLTKLVDDFMTTTKLERKNVYAIMNYCKKSLRNKKAKIEEYIKYNKDNKIKYVNKVVEFYVNNKLSQYMA